MIGDEGVCPGNQDKIHFCAVIQARESPSDRDSSSIQVET
jgi:hypothetical protein